MRTANRNSSRRGMSVIEMFLVLSLLSVLTFGAMEFGYYFFLKNSVQGAAREGVRAGIPSGAQYSDIGNEVLRQLRDVAGLLPSSASTTGNYTVTVQRNTPVGSSTWTNITDQTTYSAIVTGDPIKVAITYNWGTVGIRLLPTWSAISTSKNVTCAAVMRKE